MDMTSTKLVLMVRFAALGLIGLVWVAVVLTSR